MRRSAAVAAPGPVSGPRDGAGARPGGAGAGTVGGSAPDRRRRRPWRAVGLALVGLAAVVFVVSNRAQLPAAAHALRQARPGFVALALVVCLLALVNQAALHQGAQRAMGVDAPFGPSLRAATAAQFLNLVAKSGGMAGMGAFVRSRAGRSGASRVVVAYVLATLLGQLSFAVVLAASLVAIWVDGRLTTADVAASLIFAAIMVAVLGAVAAGARSRESLRWAYGLPRRLLLRARSLGRREQPPAAATDHSQADDLYDAVRVLARRPRAAARAGLHALGVEALGALLLWTVLMAVGEHPGVKLPVVAYAISVLFAIVGFLPGGLGFVEAGLGAVLISYGVAAPVAAVAVILYRVFELWVPVVIGAWAAQSLARVPARASRRR